MAEHPQPWCALIQHGVPSASPIPLYDDCVTIGRDVSCGVRIACTDLFASRQQFELRRSASGAVTILQLGKARSFLNGLLLPCGCESPCRSCVDTVASDREPVVVTFDSDNEQHQVKGAEPDDPIVSVDFPNMASRAAAHPQYAHDSMCFSIVGLPREQAAIAAACSEQNRAPWAAKRPAPPLATTPPLESPGKRARNNATATILEHVAPAAAMAAAPAAARAAARATVAPAATPAAASAAPTAAAPLPPVRQQSSAGVFGGLKLCVPKVFPGHATVARVIEKHGGALEADPAQATHVLLDGHLEPAAHVPGLAALERARWPPIYAVAWQSECVKAKRLITVPAQDDIYRHPSDPRRQQQPPRPPGQRTQSTPSPRAAGYALSSLDVAPAGSDGGDRDGRGAAYDGGGGGGGGVVGVGLCGGSSAPGRLMMPGSKDPLEPAHGILGRGSPGRGRGSPGGGRGAGVGGRSLSGRLVAAADSADDSEDEDVAALGPEMARRQGLTFKELLVGEVKRLQIVYKNGAGGSSGGGQDCSWARNQHYLQAPGAIEAGLEHEWPTRVQLSKLKRVHGLGEQTLKKIFEVRSRGAMGQRSAAISQDLPFECQLIEVRHRPTPRTLFSCASRVSFPDL